MLKYFHYKVAPQNSNETNCVFVSSRGLLKSCTHHQQNPKSSSFKVVDIHGAHLQSGDSIYVPSDALENFSSGLMRQINKPFVLVTGDSDRAVNAANIGQNTWSEILNNPNLTAWFPRT